MKETLVIRCSKEEYEVMKSCPKFEEKWVTHAWELTTVIEGEMNDPDFRECFEHLRSKVDYAVSYFEREYTKKELTDAALLAMRISAAFEPTGEEVGTIYKYPCAVCKAGRITKGNLILNLSRVPKGKDIIQTISRDEWIISERLAALIKKHNISGIRMKPVINSTNRKLKSIWYQLIIRPHVIVSDKTIVGTPFKPCSDMEGMKTSCGHAIKAVPLSELFVEKDSWDGSDVIKTDLYFGGHMNLVYPYPEILISQRFYRVLQENSIRGYDVEIVHLV